MNKKTRPQHAPMQQFNTLAGELEIAGMPLSKAVAIAGQTPCYLYSRQVIRQNIAHWRQQMPDWLRLHYAVKANPMPALVDYVATQVDGLDVASGKELHLALNSGMSATNISFAGPGKREQELRMAIAAGITINVESTTELQRILHIAQGTETKARVALRINPDFSLKASGMKMGGGAQQFGIDAEQVTSLKPLLADEHLQLIGLHIFTGSQNLRAESLIEAHNGIFALAKRIADELNIHLQKLNIGGGLGIPYFPGDKPLDIAPIGANLKRLRQEYKSFSENCEIAMELGRYLVGNAGLYVCRVTDIKNSRGQSFVITDGGLHHHLAASGNFGQVIRKNYPLAIGNKMDKPKSDEFQVVGPLCTPLDILGDKVLLPKVDIGDLVVVYQSGAYGFSASPRDFLSHPQPVQLLL